MDIVSSLPFTLKLIQEYPMYRETSALNFSLDEKEIWVNGFVTLEAEENDEIDLLFDSDDSNARLYLDALDIVPIDDTNVQEDEYGKLYRKVSAENLRCINQIQIMMLCVLILLKYLFYVMEYGILECLILCLNLCQKMNGV